jgi:NAD(P)H-hydrate epimerase
VASSPEGTSTASVGVPSGLDATSGTVFAPCVRAAATLTLALPKVGLRAPEARAVVGELYLADIGVPPSVYAGLGHAVGPIFARASTLRLDGR